MSVRGRGSRRGRGRPRGSVNKKTITWEWETYEPGQEVYDSLFRLRKAPPVITPSLSNDCPIPHAETRILQRRQTEDGLRRQYYRVLVQRAPPITSPQDGASNAHSAGSLEAAEDLEDEVDEVEEVDVSRILHFVSPRELERFENAEFRAEAEAEAVARRVAAEELARMRLERNARVPGAGRGSRMLAGLGLPGDRVIRRGRPPKRGWSRGGGRGRGRAGQPGYMSVGERTIETEEGMQDTMDNVDDDEDAMKLDVLEYPESPERIMDETDEDDELDAQLPVSPVMSRSSFVLGSALADSPTLRQRTVTEMAETEEEEEEEEDRSSVSSATQQLLAEHQYHEHLSPVQDSDSDSDSNERGRHRSKRRRTESSSSTRLPPSRISTSAPSRSHGPIVLQSRAPAPKAEESEPEPEPESDEDEDEFAVEAVLAHSYDNGKKFYLVKWAGYSDAEDWVIGTDLGGAQDLVEEYEARLRSRRR